MIVVAGISLKNLEPRVWDSSSPYYLPDLQAVMVSYAEFHRMPVRRREAMKRGLHDLLGIPKQIQVYLDNGAFYFLRREGQVPRHEYEEFVTLAKPDWYPIPQDFIPTPRMTLDEQRDCYRRTMSVNRAYEYDGFVPVIHISNFLKNYTVAIARSPKLSGKKVIALGGIVPNLLRASKAIPYQDILASIQYVRRKFADKQFHVFGIGGTSTLHLAYLLKIDSVDSSGWRNRAARGIVQLPGSGDRMTADLGSWRGRKPSVLEWDSLKACRCPACLSHGTAGLKAERLKGFANRATHNLATLLDESILIKKHISEGTYSGWYSSHVDNSTYLPIIKSLIV